MLPHLIIKYRKHPLLVTKGYQVRSAQLLRCRKRKPAAVQGCSPRLEARNPKRTECRTVANAYCPTLNATHWVPAQRAGAPVAGLGRPATQSGPAGKSPSSDGGFLSRRDYFWNLFQKQRTVLKTVRLLKSSSLLLRALERGHVTVSALAETVTSPERLLKRTALAVRVLEREHVTDAASAASVTSLERLLEEPRPWQGLGDDCWSRAAARRLLKSAVV